MKTRKLVKRIALGAVCAYLAGSAALSLTLHYNPERGYKMLDYRAPLLAVEVVTATVRGSGDGTLFGISDTGVYMGYSEARGEHIGDTVTSVMIYNPLNNWFDDIIARYDF